LNLSGKLSVQHTTLSNWAAVEFAGLVEIDQKSRVSEIKLTSGHYQPGKRRLACVIPFLERATNLGTGPNDQKVEVDEKVEGKKVEGKKVEEKEVDKKVDKKPSWPNIKVEELWHRIEGRFSLMTKEEKIKADEKENVK
jgi:hypothetical protein